MSFWLFKTEPGTYAWEDLDRDGVTQWKGIRDFQTRDILRDDVRLDDLVFVYHIGVRPQSIAGIARVCREAYPDHSSWDPSGPEENPDDPRWLAVDVEPVRTVVPPITRDELAAVPELSAMILLGRGSGISVQPVSESEAAAILGLRKIDPMSLG